MKLVIIGAGPGGYAAAIRAARLGAQVALVEKDAPGGTCLNRGCIPSKIMRHAADLMRDVAGAASFGIVGDTASFAVNMKTLRAKQRQIVDAQAKGLAAHFKHLGIQLVRGAATVEKPGLVTVEAESFEYDNLLIAVGSVPSSLPGLTVDGDKIISSDQALWMEEKPQSMLVVGGGVIGCELAQIFHDFGTKVSIVEGLSRLLPLPGLDEEISKTYMRCLKKLKLPYFTGMTLAGVTPTASGVKAVIKPFSGEGETRELEFDKILVSIGRRPAVEGLGLEKLGVEFDERGWLKVSTGFRANIPNIWAIGDCLGPSRVMLAHVATAEALAAVENMFGGDKTVDYQAVPSAVFTSPEIGSVGLTLAEAQEKDPASRASDFLFRQLGKAQAMGETEGLFRLIVNSENRIVGGHILGVSATSILAELTLAMTRGLSADEVANTIHAHPTLPEGVWEAAMSAAGRPLHGA